MSSKGTVAIEKAVSVVMKAASGWEMIPEPVACPMMTKANSPAGASSSAVRSDTVQLCPNSRTSGTRRAIFAAISPMKAAANSSGILMMMAISMDRPTERKNAPSNSVLKGSSVASIARRYSVSARMRPATKAPSAMETPKAAVTMPVPTTMRTAAAMKACGSSTDATCFSSGRQHEAADQDDDRDGHHALQHRDGEAAEHRAAATGCQCADQKQERNDRQILHQQDSECGAPGSTGQPALGGEVLDHDGGGRQGQRAADDDGGGAACSRPPGDKSNDRHGADDLCRAEAEHQLLHAGEALVGQLDADEKQEEDDAELAEHGEGGLVRHGDIAEPGQCGNELAEPMGANDGTDAEEAEGGGNAEPPEDGNGDRSRAEDQDNILVRAEVDGCCHAGEGLRTGGGITPSDGSLRRIVLSTGDAFLNLR